MIRVSVVDFSAKLKSEYLLHLQSLPQLQLFPHPQLDMIGIEGREITRMDGEEERKTDW
ncbi:hypothetical protein MHM582_3602, partial [Microbacterium sp. HM58-2]